MKVKAQLTIEGENAARIAWEQEGIQWSIATTKDIAAHLATLAANKRGEFEVAVILRPTGKE